ncbi:MAG: MgtC/SapB family protein [Anaerolineae bacterium]|nr:MgtC/SapB family protein [Anaerolineae bacterium]
MHLGTVLPKLLLAIVAGGLIGFEREYRGKTAGLRTIIFICLGATVFTILSLEIGGPADPSRIAAAIVSGVGFLGAGAILRGEGQVTGLTTASTIWLAAAVGMGVGSGAYLVSASAVTVAMAILWVFPLFENRMERRREVRTYDIALREGPLAQSDVEQLFRNAGLDIEISEHGKEHGVATWTLEARGHRDAHQQLLRLLIADEQVTKVSISP